MGLSRLSEIVNVKHSLYNLNKKPQKALDFPKGYFAVYVGESDKKRFVAPILLLNEPTFQELLSMRKITFKKHSFDTDLYAQNHYPVMYFTLSWRRNQWEFQLRTACDHRKKMYKKQLDKNMNYVSASAKRLITPVLNME
ncbi:Small auxin-up RNA [Parasponia andersonii]|uniref:Small auxin-up RNA n=1 Tax=Parasponia andersonii TaxID=3476 RepID=A0A2P5AT86_PARAD|nr:Small auxin-up RNA [Parasponia andersonii]